MASPEAEHRARKIKKKAVFDRTRARATRRKGLLIVHTGAGKGKTTAALGMAFRAMGHGMRVAVVQFIKGAIPTGELALARRGDLPIALTPLGEGFTWETQDRRRDIEAARRAWEQAAAALADPAYALVILDELNVVLHYGYLPLPEVLAALRARRPELHVVVTGRYAAPEILELADLATEMRLIKHPYRSGIAPQEGIEF